MGVLEKKIMGENVSGAGGMKVFWARALIGEREPLRRWPGLL
jgi:hypothetical protein